LIGWLTVSIGVLLWCSTLDRFCRTGLAGLIEKDMDLSDCGYLSVTALYTCVNAVFTSWLYSITCRG